MPPLNQNIDPKAAFKKFVLTVCGFGIIACWLGLISAVLTTGSASRHPHIIPFVCGGVGLTIVYYLLDRYVWPPKTDAFPADTSAKRTLKVSGGSLAFLILLVVMVGIYFVTHA